MNSAIATELKPLQKKWGDGLGGGFLLIPTLLLKRQKELLLDNTELVVLLNLLAAWWDAGKRPYPRPTTIAKRMGVTARTVQRSLEKLEKKGLILRVRSGTGIGSAHRELTSYEMAGTVEKIQQLAEVAEHFQKKGIRGKEDFDELQASPASLTVIEVFNDEAQRR